MELKAKIDGLLTRQSSSETLMRCTTNLLSKLSDSPVDTRLLRENVDKLEQYHDLGIIV